MARGLRVDTDNALVITNDASYKVLGFTQIVGITKITTHPGLFADLPIIGIESFRGGSVGSFLFSTMNRRMRRITAATNSNKVIILSASNVTALSIATEKFML